MEEDLFSIALSHFCIRLMSATTLQMLSGNLKNNYRTWQTLTKQFPSQLKCYTIVNSHTMTSNCSGFETSCMQQLSTIISLYLIPGYFVATSRQDSKNRPSASFIMFALCTAVTFFLLFRYAYSKAYFAMRSEQNFVIT